MNFLSIDNFLFLMGNKNLPRVIVFAQMWQRLQPFQTHFQCVFVLGGGNVVGNGSVASEPILPLPEPRSLAN